MLDPSAEQELLRRALARGWLTSDDLRRTEPGSVGTFSSAETRFGQRIDALLRAGHLTESAVQRLLAELESPSPAAAADREVDLAFQHTHLSPATPAGGPSAGAADQAAPEVIPVEGWDDYQILELLGQGGMGTVYKARDRRLGRIVALKFIRRDRSMVARFMQEARAQARVTHENVCKVYEVGEVAGKPYIAMQFIEGAPLSELVHKLTLEEKVQLMRDTAGALHAAHRLGIIHRDVKPGNVMVARNEDGSLRPVVMDFGLAYDDEEEDRLTRTGALLGTPAYMSPEQARGETHGLDRRTDIYSLGAMLYELLTGTPPFDGVVIETLMQIMMKDPLAVRQRVAAVPADLETITMKCLEKEPARRYESAQALARDLSAYLEGEPIAARPLSFAGRLLRRARKHRGLTILAGAALILVLGATGMTAWTQWRAARQAQLAQQLGEEVKEIEGILQRAYLLPAHDIRPEQQMVRARIARIAAQLDALGASGQGPGHYALGRGYLALSDSAQARIELEAALRSGYSSPSLSYALGRVLGDLYRREMQHAERILNKARRQDRMAILDREYRQPALAHLSAYLQTAPQDSRQPATYAQGLLAFYKKEYETAQRDAEQAFSGQPWLYEAKKLRGDIELAQGIVQQEKGQFDRALTAYARAGIEYRRALEVGRSDPELQLAEAGRLRRMLATEIARGSWSADTLHELLSVCDRALIVKPDSSVAYTNQAWGHLWLAVSKLRSGEVISMREDLDRAILLSVQAVRHSPGDATASGTLTLAELVRASYHTRSQRVGGLTELVPILSSYLNEFESNGGFEIENTLGRAALELATYKAEHGVNPDADFELSLRKYSDAAARHDNHFLDHLQRSRAYLRWARYKADIGQDPLPLLEQAIESGEQTARLNDHFHLVYYQLAHCYLAKAESLAAQGRDFADSFERARTNFLRKVQVDEDLNYEVPPPGLGRLYVVRARSILQRGGDPTPDLSAANKLFEKAFSMTERRDRHLRERSEAELVAARFAMQNAQREVAERELAAAETAITQLIARQPDSAELHLVAAEIYRRRAEWNMGGDGGRAESIARGLVKIERALTIHPGLVAARAEQAALRALQTP